MKPEEKIVTVHNLKTWPEFYEPVEQEIKTVEIRKNDRNFQVGDILRLAEYFHASDRFTGRVCHRWVTHILGEPWVPEGYVALSIKPLTVRESKKYFGT